METWTNLSVDAFKACRVLRSRHVRSCVSRAYYAAYAAITLRLNQCLGITYGLGRGNPAHGRVLDYLQFYAAQLGYSQEILDRVKGNFRDLRRDRERADYKPHSELDEHDSKESLRRSEQILRDLNIPIGA